MDCHDYGIIREKVIEMNYKYFSVVRFAMEEAISPFSPLDDKFLIMHVKFKVSAS